MKKIILCTGLVITGLGLAFGVQKIFGPAITSVHFSSEQIIAQIAETPAEHARGLSGKKYLAKNAGLLFVFENPNKHCFWMKGTELNLDIIWLNESKQVVYLEQNLTPATYPQVFCPDRPAMYVLEVNAGKASELGLNTGNQLFW